MSWEEAFIVALRSIANPFLDAAFLAFSELGGDVFWLAVIFACLALRKRRQALGFSILLIANFYISYALKYAIGRPRPPLWLQRTDLVEAEVGPSMPSTHAAEAASNMAYLAREIGDRRAYLACALLIALTSLSRVYLGVHWPTDVLAGALLGLLVAFSYMTGAEERILSKLSELSARKALLIPIPLLAGLAAALLTPGSWGRPSTYIGGLVAGIFMGILAMEPPDRPLRHLGNAMRTLACVLTDMALLAASYLLGPGLLQFAATFLAGLWASWLGPRALWALRRR